MQHVILNTAVAAILLVSCAQADQCVLLPTAEKQAVTWNYTTSQPGDRWMQEEFDDAAWKQGCAGFGTRGTPGSVIGTRWDEQALWIRTAFQYDGRTFERAVLRIHFDEDAVVYLNGAQIAELRGYTTAYGDVDVTRLVRRALREGTNVIAASGRQTYGGQYIDLGLVLDPEHDVELAIRIPERMPEATGSLPPIAPLFDHAVRDTSICVGPDRMYYLTGTTADNPAGPEDKTGWWYVNEGIRVWRSGDLVNWEPLGLVWSLDKDATWAKEFKTDGRGTRRRACWAPDIHYVKGTFWLTYSMNYRGCGLLKSISGRAEGPYVDVKTDGPLTDEIDASLFQDDDGTVYWVYQNGKLAKMNDDLTGLTEMPRLLKPSNSKQVGFEGAYLTKRDGRYYLICADFIDGLYHCMVAQADRVYGPYGPRYVAIPHGGHNMFFADKEGNWWATFFGNDRRAPFRERPAILRIELDDRGRVRPQEHTPRAKR